jgi:hypothetical protein
MKCVLAVLFSIVSSAAVAQTTGAANPNTDPTPPSVKDDVPPGGCMPIGLTASGEIVFPIQCKEFIERVRGPIAEQKPAAVEDKLPAKQSAAEQKPAALDDPTAIKRAAPEMIPPPADEKPPGKQSAAEQNPAVPDDKPAIKQSAEPTASVPEEKSAVQQSAVEQKPAAPEEKPSADPQAAVQQNAAAMDEKVATRQSDSATPDSGKPPSKPLETASLPKHPTSTSDCSHFRTYDRASGTYRGFDGRTRPCR